MTTIAVIAAGGRSGRVFVKAALDAGYAVRAGVHSKGVFPSHDKLTIVACDATNQQDVGELLEGADVVVSLIGHGRKSPARVQTEAFRVITAVMQQKKLRRLISLTGTGVRFPGDTPSIFDRLANKAIALIDPNRIQDGIDHVELLKSTSLDWTVLRVLKLSDGSHRGMVRLSRSGPAEFLTPRKRVAEAILQLLVDDGYIHQAPVIVGKG